MRLNLQAARLGLIAAAMVVSAEQSWATNLTPPQQAAVTSVGGSKSVSHPFLLVTTNVTVVGCEGGFWLPGTDPNYSNTLSMMMTAMAQKRIVTLSGDMDQMWSGAIANVCMISSAQLS